jgi:rod shape-determining protein MreD
MSRHGYGRRLPVILTIVLAIMLAIVPLPEQAEPYRPDWVAVVLIYWAMMLPRTWSVGSAWLVGLVLDAAQGTILGQHALALTVVIFITVRFHLLMRVFPMQQLTATVFALLALYQFLLFWTNGVAGTQVDIVYYWAPVVSGTLLWPIVTLLLAGVRAGAPSRR